MEKWRSGEVEEWRSGEVEEWRSGEGEEGRSGEEEEVGGDLRFGGYYSLLTDDYSLFLGLWR